MSDANDIIRIVKTAAAEAMESAKPMGLYYGTVESTGPIKIRIDQKTLLGKAQLVILQNVTDYSTNITVDWTTEETSTHTHAITGKKQITVHNALKVNDKVLLIREQGGQKYIVIDKVVS